MFPKSGSSSQPPGRVVPVYVLTRGRTRSAGVEMPLESLLSTTDLARKRGGELKLEYRNILDLVTHPVSIMEISAWLQVPAGVARVLVSDLADAGYLIAHTPPPTEPDGRPSTELLERLMEGLRAL